MSEDHDAFDVINNERFDAIEHIVQRLAGSYFLAGWTLSYGSPRIVAITRTILTSLLPSDRVSAINVQLLCRVSTQVLLE